MRLNRAHRLDKREGKDSFQPQSSQKKKRTYIRLQSLGPPAIAVELGRLHRLSKGDAVGFVFLVLLLIIKWTCVALLRTGKR